MDEEFDSFIKMAMSKAKRRMTSQERKKAERAFWSIYQLRSVAGWHMQLAMYIQRVFEQIAPGSVSMVSEGVERKFPHDPEHQLSCWARVLDQSKEELRRYVEKLQGV